MAKGQHDKWAFFGAIENGQIVSKLDFCAKFLDVATLLPLKACC
jgi:hypothetical protein